MPFSSSCSLSMSLHLTACPPLPAITSVSVPVCPSLCLSVCHLPLISFLPLSHAPSFQIAKGPTGRSGQCPTPSPCVPHLWEQLLWAGKETSSASDRPTSSTWGPDGNRFLKKLNRGPGVAKPAKAQRPKVLRYQTPSGSLLGCSDHQAERYRGWCQVPRSQTPGSATGGGAGPLEIK